MPGDFVGPVSPGIIAGIPGAPAIAPGFLPGVLGEATPSAALALSDSGLIKGSQNFPWWWLLLLLLFPLPLFWYWRMRRMG